MEESIINERRFDAQLINALFAGTHIPLEIRDNGETFQVYNLKDNKVLKMKDTIATLKNGRYNQPRVILIDLVHNYEGAEPLTTICRLFSGRWNYEESRNVMAGKPRKSKKPRYFYAFAVNNAAGEASYCRIDTNENWRYAEIFGGHAMVVYETTRKDDLFKYITKFEKENPGFTVFGRGYHGD